MITLEFATWREVALKRHWSFVVTDKRYLYPLAFIILAVGLAAAFALREPNHFVRAGNFIIGTGVWMSMRHTLREGISRHKNHADSFPTRPGTNEMNSNFFNQAAYSVGDAHLQLHGFALVLVGSAAGSFGDLILRAICPSWF